MLYYTKLKLVIRGGRMSKKIRTRETRIIVQIRREHETTLFGHIISISDIGVTITKTEWEPSPGDTAMISFLIIGADRMTDPTEVCVTTTTATSPTNVIQLRAPRVNTTRSPVNLQKQHANEITVHFTTMNEEDRTTIDAFLSTTPSAG